MEFTTCPECRSIARVLDRFVLESTDGPVEHVRTQCVERHWFVLPASALARRASEQPAAGHSPVRGTVPGAAGCG